MPQTSGTPITRDSEGEVTRPSRDNRTERLYRQIYTDTSQRVQATTVTTIQQAEPSPTSDKYDETVIAIHHSKKGFRIVFQANHKAAIVIVAIALILLTRPGILDLLITFVRSLFQH